MNNIVLATSVFALVFAFCGQCPAETDHEFRIKILCANLNCTFDDDGDARIVIDGEGEEDVVIYVAGTTQGFGRLKMRQVWSVGVCSNHIPDEAKINALRMNGYLKIGSWKLFKESHEEALVFNCSIPAEADSETITTAVLAVGSTVLAFRSGRTDKMRGDAAEDAFFFNYDIPSFALESMANQGKTRDEPQNAGSSKETSGAFSRNEGVIADLIDSMVAIPERNYKIGKYEVTQAQWNAVMGNNPSRYKGANNPVEQISLKDCQEFLKKLNVHPAVKESKLTFRLPSAEEWEYACRAGSSGNYCRLANGTDITESTLGLVAWFWDNSNLKTHPVGQKHPNAFGLYDMFGNVAEWASSADEEDYLRCGGCFHYLAEFCTASDKIWDGNGADRNLGFRLCAD